MEHIFGEKKIGPGRMLANRARRLAFVVLAGASLLGWLVGKKKHIFGWGIFFVQAPFPRLARLEGKKKEFWSLGINLEKNKKAFLGLGQLSQKAGVSRPRI